MARHSPEKSSTERSFVTSQRHGDMRKVRRCTGRTVRRSDHRGPGRIQGPSRTRLEDVHSTSRPPRRSRSCLSIIPAPDARQVTHKIGQSRAKQVCRACPTDAAQPRPTGQKGGKPSIRGALNRGLLSSTPAALQALQRVAKCRDTLQWRAPRQKGSVASEQVRHRPKVTSYPDGTRRPRPTTRDLQAGAHRL